MIKLYNRVSQYGPLCLGIDSVKHIILLEKLKDLVRIVKFQSAFFEMEGPNGLNILQESISHAKSLGYYVILDAKRSDISTTAIAYAKAAFDIYDADALTIVPFMGKKSIKVFADYARELGRQIFVVVNPTEPSIKYDKLGLMRLIRDMDNVGVVLSSLSSCAIYRVVAPNTFFLIPGMGTQGGRIKDQLAAFVNKNLAVLSYSRTISDADNVIQTVLNIKDEMKECGL